MFNAQPHGLGAVDPNLSRVIEETIGVVSDVENRLQALKIGISQALPHLAPTLLWREQALAGLASRNNLYGPLFGANIGLPTLGMPMSHGFHPGFSGIPAQGVVPGSLFGVPTIGGVTNPVGFAPSFRIW